MILDFSLSSWVYNILALIYVITIISCVAVVLSENRNPIKSLAWITVLIFLPLVGLLFYLFFGRNPKSLHLINRHNKRKLLHDRPPSTVKLRDTASLSNENRQIVKLADSIASAPLCIGNEIDIFTSGPEKFDALKKDLENAKESIYLQYYIFADDRLGHEIAEILMRKAREGVSVKVLYDHVGSFSVKSGFFRKMRKAGVDAHPFFRVTFPQLANRVNWRNHRKMVIIDSETGYIGGMNIADRYADAEARWRDTHFRVRGSVVNILKYSFAIDWNFMRKEFEFEKTPSALPAEGNDMGVQLLTSGPGETWSSISMAFLKAIASAQKSIYIQTPYFLPTDALLKALQAAALSRIDVRIMLPRKSDSRLLNLASYSYVTQCLQAGIKIYFYEPGMLHAKTMIIDDDFVTGGSTNFDFRSFEHNFEANIFIYDKAFNRRMRDIFFDDLSRCSKITLAKWHRRPRWQRFLESIVRLMSPVL